MASAFSARRKSSILVSFCQFDVVSGPMGEREHELRDCLYWTDLGHVFGAFIN